MSSWRRALIFALVLAAVMLPERAAAPAYTEPGGASSGILQYIDSAWEALTRSLTDCKTSVDAKSHSKSLLYLPAGFAVPPEGLPLERDCGVEVAHLPHKIEAPAGIDLSAIQPHALLYLPHPYVVPGGFFNEMYGWDSYFIIRGLVEAGKLELALDMVENFFFEIEHYGMILNANRGYFLSRSQPPFLTSMIRAVFEPKEAAGHADRNWLARAYGYAVKDYSLWTHEPHLASDTGLSRYFDFGDGPVPELAENDSTYYRDLMGYFLVHPDSADHYLVTRADSAVLAPLSGPSYALKLCQPGTAVDECVALSEISLSPDYYKADRSMRESGFDISFRFGPYSAGTHHYAPVCLNSLLYKVEKDLEWMSSKLGRASEERDWHDRASVRRVAIQKYLWNQQRGLFFDYNFDTRLQSTYEYATTFYPLWAGAATKEQAAAVARNLPRFEQAGGIPMSREETGVQWDYPYGWAPLQLITVEGLRSNGFANDADRLAKEWLSMVQENFRRDGTIREKYNVVTRSSETKITAGYKENVIGFGWTNGVFLVLLHQLPKDVATRLGL